MFTGTKKMVIDDREAQEIVDAVQDDAVKREQRFWEKLSPKQRAIAAVICILGVWWAWNKYQNAMQPLLVIGVVVLIIYLATKGESYNILTERECAAILKEKVKEWQRDGRLEMGNVKIGVVGGVNKVEGKPYERETSVTITPPNDVTYYYSAVQAVKGPLAGDILRCVSRDVPFSAERLGEKIFIPSEELMEQKRRERYLGHPPRRK